MPVVPRNTISEPSGSRLPQVSMPVPRIAEAMGAVASAHGRRASAIGGMASAAGEHANAIGRQFGLLSKIEEIKAGGQQAKWNAISNIGQTVANTGIDLDRIYDRKAREQAEIAGAEYTDYLTRTSNGYKDEQTGQWVPGTLDTAYSPGNEKDEPMGPSISSAKKIKEWKEDENGTYAKMNPLAKDYFNRNAARIEQSLFERASKAEYNQMVAFRAATQKAALEADRNHLKAVGVDPSAENTWVADSGGAVSMAVIREFGDYQKDKGNQILSEAEWTSPEIAAQAKLAEDAYRQVFFADRVDILLLAAQSEQDDAKRESMLAAAMNTAEAELSGKRILSEEVVQKTRLDVGKIRLQASSMQAAQLKTAIDKAHDLKAQTILTGDPKAAQELDGLLQTLPPHVAVEVRQTQDAAHYQREMAMLEDAKADWLSVIGTPQESAVKEKMLLVAQGMTNERARLRAPAVIQSAESTKATAFQTARADELEMAVWLGGRKGPDGSFISMTDAELTTEIANSDIPFQRGRDLMGKIAERQDRDPVVEKKIYKALDGILGIDADASFKLADGMFEYEMKKKDGVDVPVTPGDSVLSKMDFSGTKSSIFDWRFNPIEDRTIKLKAELIRNVAQDAYDYYRQQKTLSKDGKEPMSIETYVRKRLMPEENEDARAWTEANIDLRIKQGQQEREDMRLLFLEQMSNANEPAAATP